MIEAMREKMQGVFATVVIVFICVMFALWSVETLFSRSAQVKAPLTVDGIDISEQQINQAVSMARERYSEMFKGKMDPSFLTDKMLREPAIESLIGRTVLAKQVAGMKMAAAPASIDREIVRNPEFSQDGQRFDPTTFKDKLRGAGMTPAMYRARLNDALVMEQLQRGVADTAFTTEKQIAAVAALEAQTRNLEYVRLAEKNAVDSIHPDDQAVEQYFNEHANEFMTEETVTLEYLDLNKAELAHEATVSDDELKEAYEKEKAAYKPSAERHAAHILVEEKSDGSEKTKLDTITQKLKAGDSFADVAKKYSDDKESAAMGGDVGVSAGDVFEPEFEKALAGLNKVGDISEPVKTRYGYHIIKLLDKKDTAFPTFDARKVALKEQLSGAKADSVYSEKLNEMTDSTYSAGDLAGPAAELKMSVQKTEAFGRRGGKGLAGQQKVIDTAFSEDLLNSGKNSQVIELSADRAVVVRVADHQLPKPKALSDVKAQIVDTIKKTQAASALKTQAETIRQRVLAGESLSEVASKEKLSRVLLENQKANASDVNAELVAHAFRLSDQSADAFQLANGDWAVIQLLAIHSAQPDKDSAAYKAVSEQMNSSVGTEEYALYQQALRQAAKIERRSTATDDNKENSEQQ